MTVVQVCPDEPEVKLQMLEQDPIWGRAIWFTLAMMDIIDKSWESGRREWPERRRSLLESIEKMDMENVFIKVRDCRLWIKAITRDPTLDTRVACMVAENEIRYADHKNGDPLRLTV